jgi:hypothetical protein
MFPSRKSFRAVSRVISMPRYAEKPSDNRWKFRWQSGERGLAESPTLLRDITGIDDLFLFNHADHNWNSPDFVDSHLCRNAAM